MRCIEIGDYIDLNEDGFFKVEDIKEGGFGKVCIGYMYIENFIFPAVMKTLKDDFFEKNELDIIRNEALSWIKLDMHPNIVNVLAYDEIDDRPFLILESVLREDNRNTLQSFISENNSDEQILDWSLQFTYGMDYCYKNGVSPHRDIKPENIMITEDNILKITDFGFAKLENMLNNEVNGVKRYFSDYISGTPGYIAPESCLKRQYDLRSDIYSFGIILYQLVSKGDYPYDSDDIYDIVDNYLKPKNIDSVFNKIIQKCLKFNEDDRYQNFQELRKDLIQLHKEQGYSSKLYYPKEIKSELNIIKAYNYTSIGEYELSNKYFEKIDLKTDNFHVTYGSCLRKQGNIIKAKKEYKEAVKLNFKNSAAHYNLANVYSDEGNYIKAEKEYKIALSLEPDNRKIHINYGNLLLETNNVDEAISHYKIAEKGKPFLFECMFNMGRAYRIKKEYDKSEKYFNKAEKINNKKYHLYYEWGLLYEDEGKYEEAIEKLEKSLKINQYDCESHFSLGRIYIKTNFKNEIEIYDKAINEFKLSIKYSETNEIVEKQIVFVILDKSMVLARQGKYNEALNVLDESFEYSNKYWQPWFEKAKLLHDISKQNNEDIFEEVNYCLDKSLELNPNNLDALILKIPWVLYNCSSNEFQVLMNNILSINPNFKLDDVFDKKNKN